MQSNSKSNEKERKIAEVDPKYMPPRPSDPHTSWSDDPQTIAFMLQHAYNQQRLEQEAKLEHKRCEQELKRMEQYEEQQRQETKRQLEYRKKLPELQLRKFAKGQAFTCVNCHSRLHFQASCGNPNCMAHTTISLEGLMHRLRNLVRNYIASEH